MTCYRCGGNYTAARCQFRGKCRACGKVGHIANCKLCRSKRAPSSPSQTGETVHKVEDPAPPEEYTLYPVVVHHQGVVTPSYPLSPLKGSLSAWRLTRVPQCPSSAGRPLRSYGQVIAAIQCQTEDVHWGGDRSYGIHHCDCPGQW